MGSEERRSAQPGGEGISALDRPVHAVGFGTPAGSRVVDLGGLVCTLVLGAAVVDAVPRERVVAWFAGSVAVLALRRLLSPHVRWTRSQGRPARRSAALAFLVSAWFAVWWVWLLPREDDVLIGVGLVTLVVLDVASAALLAAIPWSFAALAIPSGAVAAAVIAASDSRWGDHGYLLLPLALGVVAVYLDRRRAYQRAAAGVERARVAALELELAFEGIRDGLAVTSNGVVLRHNEPMRRLVTPEESELVGRSLTDILQLAPGQGIGAPDLVLVEGRKGTRTVEIEGRTAPSHPDLVVWVCRDVTSRVQAERQLRELVGHDDLTALANRRTMLEHLGEVLGTTGPVSVLVIDLDGFKEINDEHGHAAGDQVLRTIAERLVSRVHDQGQVSRMGGDEFVVVLNCFGAGALGPTLAKDLVAELSQPIWTDRGWLEVTASVGVAQGLTGEAPADVLHRADVAMYTAKRSGRNSWYAAQPMAEGTEG